MSHTKIISQKRQTPCTHKSRISKKICTRTPTLLDIPTSWLCLIFTYLSHNHHLLILPFICKTLNIITKHKESWPPEFSFNEQLVSLEKYKNYPFDTVKIKYIDHPRCGSIFISQFLVYIVFSSEFNRSMEKLDIYTFYY
jgi:hypothetical protein